MGKPTICIGENNKDEDQLCGNREADQRLCFRHSDTIIPLRNFKLLALFCACTGQFVSDLFGNHIVGVVVLGIIHTCIGLRYKPAFTATQ